MSPRKIRREFRAKHPIRNTVTFYLAGPVQKHNKWITWRTELTEWLNAHGMNVSDPMRKYGDPLREKHKILDEMIPKEKTETVRDYIRHRIIDPDIDFMRKSNACIAVIDDFSVGTSAELFWFYLHKQPVYVVTSIPRREWSGWLVGLSTLIFSSLIELKAYLGRWED